MKVCAVLIFTSFWLIHIRCINAQRGNHGTPYRAPSIAHVHHHHKNGPFRRQLQPQYQSHIHKHPKTNNKPIGHTSNHKLPVAGFKKKWYPPLQQRRPPQPAANFMKQRLEQSQQQFPQPSQQLPLPVPEKLPGHQHQQIKFHSSPKIIQSDIDFHLNKNQIPQAPIAQNPVAIKLLPDDEKGPIHTIPAPNLSAADKPKHIKIQSSGIHHIHHHHLTKVETPIKTSHHQYQVTEVSEPISSIHHTQDHIQATIPPLFQYSEVPERMSARLAGIAVKEQSITLLPVQDSYAYSVLHQSQQPVQIPPFFRPEEAFLKQQHKLIPTPPEMHTFNYVEPHSTRVSAEYVLEPEAAIVDQEEGQSQRDEEMMIYVPDDAETLDSEKELEKYEEDSNNGNNDKRVKDSTRFGYGSRLQPKKI